MRVVTKTKVNPSQTMPMKLGLYRQTRGLDCLCTLYLHGWVSEINELLLISSCLATTGNDPSCQPGGVPHKYTGRTWELNGLTRIIYYVFGCTCVRVLLMPVLTQID